MNNTQRLTDLAGFVVSEAKRLGATDCEVTISTGAGVDVGVRLGEIEQLQGAEDRDMKFRALVGHNAAETKTSDFRRRSLTKMIRTTIALAKSSEADPHAGLPEADQLAKLGAHPALERNDPAIASLSTDRMIELALQCEAAAQKFDARVTNSEGAGCSTGTGTTVFANSRGFVGAYEGSSCSLNAGVVASENGTMQVGSWWHASRSLAKLESPEQVGIEAAKRAVRQLGARKPKSQIVPVVFDPQMAARLLSQFIGCASGAHVYRNSSFLAGKLGETVAVKDLVIVDDGHIPGALGSRPFDEEGLPTDKRIIVQDGKLLCYLLNSYAARRIGDGAVPNGGGVTNLFIQAGNTTPEAIIASIQNGLYLTSVSGPGFNATNGDYSMGASGIWIENGQLAYPVEEFTVAGNVLEMFQAIEAIGSDLELRSSVSAPTLKIGKMTVAGS